MVLKSKKSNFVKASVSFMLVIDFLSFSAASTLRLTNWDPDGESPIRKQTLIVLLALNEASTYITLLFVLFYFY